MSKTIQRKWPVVLVAAALRRRGRRGAGAGRTEVRREVRQDDAPVEDGPLYLSNVSGDIEILTSKDAQVKIEAVKISKADSLEKAKENAAKVTIEVTGDGRPGERRDEIPQAPGRILGRRLDQRLGQLQGLGA